MVRKIRTMADNRDDAETAAWREYGKRNYAWIVGWAITKRLVVPALIVVPVGLLVLWVVRTAGRLSAAPPSSSAPVSAGRWPWVLFGISVTCVAALLAYRWANPYRGGKKLLAAVLACILISVLAVMWARTAP
jgi:uncharacterized BrkB/YihY/UPF0761 family membrane protein